MKSTSEADFPNNQPEVSLLNLCRRSCSGRQVLLKVGASQKCADYQTQRYLRARNKAQLCGVELRGGGGVERGKSLCCDGVEKWLAIKRMFEST